MLKILFIILNINKNHFLAFKTYAKNGSFYINFLN